MTPELTAALDALLAWHTDPHRQILAPPVDAVIAAWDKETEVDEMSEKTLGQVAYVVRHEREHNDAARTYLGVIKRMSPVIELGYKWLRTGSGGDEYRLAEGLRALQELEKAAAEAAVGAYLMSNERMEDRELDRQYYLSKIDELGDCLTKLREQEPVIEAAEAWADDDDRHPRFAQFLMLAVDQFLMLAVDAYRAAKERE